MVWNIINGGLFDPSNIFGGINFTMPNTTTINNGYANSSNINIGNVIDPYVVVNVSSPIFTTNTTNTTTVPSIPSSINTTITNTTIPVIEPLNPTIPIIPTDPSITLPDDPNIPPIIPIIPNV